MYSSLTAGLITTVKDVAIRGLQKRADKSEGATIFDQLPEDLVWWLVLAALNCLVFVPPIIFLSYSVNSLWPVLTILEDDAPPAYERIALQDRDEGNKEDESGKPESSSDFPYADEAGSCPSKQVPVTSEIRSLNRMLYAIEGWPSLLRGLRPHMFLNLSTTALTAILAAVPYLPHLLASALAPLAIIQLYTAWIHIAISKPSGQPFFRRFLGYKTVFRATALPSVVMGAGIGLSEQLPLYLLLEVIGIDTWDPTGYEVPVPYFDGRFSDFLKLGVMLAGYLLPTILIVVPAQVVLTRIQASLLPSEERTIMHFDRTFQGERSHDAEYITVGQAWRSFSRAAWLRLAKMYTKVLLITLAAAIFIGAAVTIQVIIVWSNLQNREGE